MTPCQAVKNPITCEDRRRRFGKMKPEQIATTCFLFMEFSLLLCRLNCRWILGRENVHEFAMHYDESAQRVRAGRCDAPFTFTSEAAL
jgi:hypothetical protein